MNLLLETAPDCITVGGCNLKIKTDFFLWVKVITTAEKNNEVMLANALLEIFTELPDNVSGKQLMEAVYGWLNFGDDKKKSSGSNNNHIEQKAFDFEQDGNVIYLELWEHFPALLQRGISYHEGIQLIGLLISNKDTVLHHRAYARCGDFSEMNGKEKNYWLRERARYAIKASQDKIDAVFSGGFM